MISSCKPMMPGKKMLDYDMEKRGELSLYEFLYRCIRNDIESGVLEAHEKLPSKRKLAQHSGMSVITVENAYTQLVAEGYCYSKPRSGYYVSDLPSERTRATRVVAPLPEKLEEDTIEFDLGSANIDPSVVSRVWGKAVRVVMAQVPDEELYAAQPSKGTYRLRKAISDLLRQTRAIHADPSCIVVGAGSQLLVASLVQLVRPVGSVALENPGYPRLSQIYASAGMRIDPVGMDEEGMDVDGLRNSLASLVHIMPSHQFPTGIVTSISRRYELLAWANEHDGRYIVEDDYDSAFRMSGRPIASMASIDVDERVIYVDTFAKSLGPALRIAFMVLPDHLARAWDERVGFYSNTVSVIDQVALAHMIESGGYERHVNRYRKTQRDVRDAFMEELASSDRDGRMRVKHADSGLHFVLEIDGADEEAVMNDARGKGVGLANVASYMIAPSDRRGKGGFVIQYGGMDAEAARKAARAVASCVYPRTR